MIEFNNNIRCIEINRFLYKSCPQTGFNNNIRCIEICNPLSSSYFFLCLITTLDVLKSDRYMFIFRRAYSLITTLDVLKFFKAPSTLLYANV